jgi:CubicO group peptidase (beta-lactamase class C family)
VVDGKLVHVAATGVRELSSKDPVTGATVFRIASMTKSFTALAILKLRDGGKLSLEDPVSSWIPEFASVPMPTSDSGILRIRHLLTHASGFPEDNPWGDQQLGATEADLNTWLKAGIPFSTPPGSRYEYSNYAFGLLGRIVALVSAMPYEQYLDREILRPLGMRSTTLQVTDVASERRAQGYRRLPGGEYAKEVPLPQGVFGAMGGLWTSAEDLGRYIAFHLDAFPARDGAETGPVRRSSVREMNAPAWFNQVSGSLVNGQPFARVASYGYGLGVAADCRFGQIVSHGGGLPGFGSHMAWLPEYGVGLFAMTNLTYAGPGQPINQAWDLFAKTGGLRPRELPASTQLIAARDRVFDYWRSGDIKILRQAAAMNLFLDVPDSQRQSEVRALQSEAGECTAVSPVQPENWLRGQFNLTCAKGTVGVFLTLAPAEPAGIQYLTFRKISPGQRLEASTSAPFGARCPQ